MAYNIKQGDKVGVLFITNAKFMCTYRLLKHWLIAKHMHVSQSVWSTHVRVCLYIYGCTTTILLGFNHYSISNKLWFRKKYNVNATRM